MPGAAERPAGGRHHRQPQVAVGVEGKAGQLTLHRQDGRIVSSVGADKVALTLFHGCTVVGSSVNKTVLGTDAVHAQIAARLPAVLAVGGEGRLRGAGVLPHIRGGVGFRRRVDGPQQQAVRQRRQHQQGKDVAGHPEAGHQGFPLDGGLCFQLGFPAGSGGRRALGAAEPPVRKEGHVRPHRDGCNEEEQYQLYESNAHEQFFLCICQISGKSFIIVV